MQAGLACIVFVNIIVAGIPVNSLVNLSLVRRVRVKPVSNSILCGICFIVNVAIIFEVIFEMCAEQLLNVKFVNAIEANPCLWDINSKRKKDRAFVSDTWDSISNQFNESVVKCRERWRNIRTAFFQSLKRYPSESSGKKYYLSSHLEFLIPTTGMRGQVPFQSCSDIEDHKALESEEDVKPGAFLEKGQSSDLTDSFRSDIQPKSTLLQLSGNLNAVDTLTCNIQHQSDGNIPCKRRKRNEEDEEDSDMTFFKSLLRDVRKMNDRQNRKFRVRVMQIANEILDPDDEEQQQKGCVYKY